MLENLVVESVEALKFDPEEFEHEGLNIGNRSAVVLAAKGALGSGADVLCIADRDCGHHLERYKLDTLVWTDYPALESYLFTPKLMDYVNEAALGDRLPPGAQLVEEIAPILLELYTVRLHNDSLPSPNIQRGFGKVKRFDHFDVKKTVSPAIADKLDGYAKPEVGNHRSYAYGHDVADVLLHLYGNQIKTQAGIPGRDNLELVFRLALLAEGTFDDEALASRLLAWVGHSPVHA
ncbi:hypothetical protein [Plantibacter sp. MMLR14_011]|uniref:hypothetical protein n=1 Tax=Plantibacter sp. MMLR14_011 TaxID=1898746 RepID=UPI0011134C60|nr:hypothetical protein [Plantibacter sp. MMLR14_011]